MTPKKTIKTAYKILLKEAKKVTPLYPAKGKKIRAGGFKE